MGLFGGATILGEVLEGMPGQVVVDVALGEELFVGTTRGTSLVKAALATLGL